MSPSSSTVGKHYQSPRSPSEEFLNMPSPYYARDEFSLPPSPHSAKMPVISSRGGLVSFLPSFLQDFTDRYLQGHHNPHENEPDDSDDEAQGYERKARSKHVHWKDTSSSHRKNWLIILTLTLLLSLLINAFLLFEGPPTGFVELLRGKQATVPHDAFRLSGLGQNHTCYHTHAQTFSRVDSYERLDGVYDHYWKDLLGGSAGYIYTELNRPDGQVRKARFAMFHQLDCLYRIRRAIQGKGGKHLSREAKDVVFIDDNNGLFGEQRWRHCFDYLRQAVLCWADDTVEVSEVVGEEERSTGYGNKRECRKSDWLYDVTKCGEHGCEGGAFYHPES